MQKTRLIHCNKTEVKMMGKMFSSLGRAINRLFIRENWFWSLSAVIRICGTTLLYLYTEFKYSQMLNLACNIGRSSIHIHPNVFHSNYDNKFVYLKTNNILYGKLFNTDFNFLISFNGAVISSPKSSTNGSSVSSNISCAQIGRRLMAFATSSFGLIFFTLPLSLSLCLSFSFSSFFFFLSLSSFLCSSFFLSSFLCSSFFLSSFLCSSFFLSSFFFLLLLFLFLLLIFLLLLIFSLPSLNSLINIL